MGVHVEEVVAQGHVEEAAADDVEEAGDAEESAGAEDEAAEVDAEVLGEEDHSAGTVRAVEAAGSSSGSHWGCK